MTERVDRTNQSLPIAALHYVAVLLLCCAAPSSAETGPAKADAALAPNAPATGDLTGLSLEQLYNLDVIQLNVIGGHTHPAGQIMFGYEFMFMDMDGHRSGTDHVSVSEILKRFPSSSTGMTAEEHMLEVMYAPTNK